MSERRWVLYFGFQVILPINGIPKRYSQKWNHIPGIRYELVVITMIHHIDPAGILENQVKFITGIRAFTTPDILPDNLNGMNILNFAKFFCLEPIFF